MARILVVDDEFGIAELLEALLEESGHRVVTAINGRDALARMAEAVPDMVISDYMMPVLDGAGLLAAMRADAALARVPFALMCALPEPMIADRIAGYDAFVRKPFKLAAIPRVVEQMLVLGRQ